MSNKIVHHFVVGQIKLCYFSSPLTHATDLLESLQSQTLSRYTDSRVEIFRSNLLSWLRILMIWRRISRSQMCRLNSSQNIHIHGAFCEKSGMTLSSRVFSIQKNIRCSPWESREYVYQLPTQSFQLLLFLFSSLLPIYPEYQSLRRSLRQEEYFHEWSELMDENVIVLLRIFFLLVMMESSGMWEGIIDKQYKYL